jgi:hypothetical protein
MMGAGQTLTSERQEVIFHPVPVDALRVATGLYDRDAHSGALHALGNRPKGRPVLQQLLGLAVMRIIEKADVRNVQLAAPELPAASAISAHSQGRARANNYLFQRECPIAGQRLHQ